MKILDSNYSIFIKNIFSYDNILKYWNESFTYIYDLLKKNKKIPTNLKQYSKEFNDRFPANFKVISNVSRFNQQAIKDLTYDSISDLLKFIDDETLILKNQLDNFDKKLEDITFSKNLELTFFNDITKLYNTDEYFLNKSNQSIDIYNKYYDIVGETDNEYLTNADTIQVFLNYLFLVNMFGESSNFRFRISSYLNSFDVFNKSSISSGFDKIIDNNIDELREILTNTVLTHNYMTVYPAPDVKEIISSAIYDSMPEFKQQFLNYLNLNYKKYNAEMTSHLVNTSTHSISKNILIELLEDGSFTTDPYSSNIKVLEEKMFDFYLSKVNEYNIKSHMFLLYTYRFWIYQFLNIMPDVIQNYVIRYIYNDEESDQKISKRDINSFIFKYVSIDVNYENYADILNQTYQDNDKLLKTINDSKCIDFALNLFFIQLFDDFLGSEQFDSFNTTLLKNIFLGLRKDGIADFDYNWYEKFIYVTLFFKTFLRKKLSDGDSFIELKSEVLNMISNIVDKNSQGRFIQNDEVIGTLGYGNIAFMTSYRFDTNGFILKLINEDNTEEIIDPNRYELNSDDQSIIFTIAPEGKKLLATYTTNYTMTTKLLISKDLAESILDEQLIGDMDGVNTIFFTSKQFNPDSLRLQLVSQYGKSDIPVDDYVADGVTKKISFDVAPLGRYIVASYYTITANELATDTININYIYKSLLTNSLNMDYTHQFMDSLYYSSLIKQITFDMLATFYLK